MRRREPTELDAAAVARRELGLEPASVTRFTTGLSNFVYEVRFRDADPVVVRLNRHGAGENFTSAVHWYHLLAPQGVPLPRLLAHDAVPPDGSFPFMIINRLPGQDLDTAYPTLTSTQKQRIAEALIDAQMRARRIPPASGFGFARSYEGGFARRYEDGGLHPSWMSLLHAELRRSQARIERYGRADPHYADAVLATLDRYRPYFEAVEPKCFLDDVALKNLIVDEGRLSGIVDVDWVCFGDPLFPVGLTEARLLRRGWNTDYISYLAEGLALGPERRCVLSLYTALWFVNTLALAGRKFGNDAPPIVDDREIPTLTHLLDELLDDI